MDIWDILLQGLTVSSVVWMLLFVKAMLKDKLSPRWQYGVWVILALRILLPTNWERSILFPWPFWVESWKGLAGYGYTSAPRWPVILYLGGVGVYLAVYFCSYLRLKWRLREGVALSPEQNRTLESTCQKYGLRPCGAVQIQDLSTAFVCGIFAPVLVLPQGDADEKVLLHELLHLKYRDNLQSVVWCALCALHWYNPLMHYTRRIIGNDLEALCDQRVLERLEGEARRDYGRILLSMASTPYPHQVGTTSLSNGGKQIARRIESIVQFQKYPKGMELVSVCAVLVLAAPLLYGNVSAISLEDFRPDTQRRLVQSMARARLNRCTTVAGALDAYAKGLLYENGLFLAMATDLKDHPTLQAEMEYHTATEQWVRWHIERGSELEYVDRSAGYSVYNLDQVDDTTYTALLKFHISGLSPEEAERLGRAEGETDFMGNVLIPVTITLQDGWVVEECGQRSIVSDLEIVNVLPQAFPLKSFQGQGDCGTVTANVYTAHRLSDMAFSGDPWHTTSAHELPKLDAAFSSVITHYGLQYQMVENPGTVTSVGMQAFALNSPDDSYAFRTHCPYYGHESPQISGGSMDGSEESRQMIDENWDGILQTGGGGTAQQDEKGNIIIPQAYAVRIYWDDEAKEDFFLQEVKP